MSNISPYGRFTGRRLYSTSKIDAEIEEILHKQRNLEPYLRMPSNPHPYAYRPRVEWLSEAREWQRGLVGTEDDRPLKERILRSILKKEKGEDFGHSAIIPKWMKIGERTFKRYFGIEYFGGKHMVMKTPLQRELERVMLGGLTNATSTAGFQEAINYLATQGTNSSYSYGGILDIFPGLYTSNDVWLLPSSTSQALDFTMHGSGKSNTLIVISPSGTKTAAIQEGYTGWIKGTQGPRFTMRDLGLSVSGTFTGTATPPGDSSGGGVVSLQYYSAYFEHVGMSIHATLTQVANLLKCGTFAGPSQPCTWNNFEIHGFVDAGNLANVVCVWFEGFHWHGGLVELQDAPSAGCGISIRSNGPNYVGQLDSYSGTAPQANNWSNFIASNGIATFEEIEYPFLSTIYTGCNGGTISAGPDNNLTIIGIQSESAVHQGDASYLSIWNNGARYIKTIGFGMGLQSGAQWCSNYLTGPFNNNQSGVGYRVGLNNYNGAKVPTASQTYTATTDLLVNSSGGTGVNITVRDQYGNPILTGVTSLSAFRMSIGMQISFGAFTTAPAVSVFQVGG